MTTSVLLADSQYLTRKGISSLVEAIPDFQLVKEINSTNELANTIYKLSPDLTILDISESNQELIAELERIKQNCQGSFLVITNTQNRGVIQKLLSIGIKGIVTKNCSQEEITNAILTVSQDNRFFCNKILDMVVDDRDKRQNCDPTTLTPREYEVTTLIAKGLSTNQIATELFLSVHTVNSHRKNILKKLNLKSPAELISYAIQSGLVNI